MDPLFALLALSLTLPTTLFKILRWKYIVRASNINIPFAEISRIFMIGFFFGVITPSKIGNIVKFHYLRKYHNVPASTGLSISVIDRIFDIIILAAFSVIGIILITTAAPTLFSLFAFIVIVLAMVTIAFNEKVFTKTAKFGILRIGSLKKLIRTQGEINPDKAAENLFRPFRQVKKPGIFYITLLLSALIWVTIGLQAYLVLVAMNTPIDPFQTIVFMGTGTLIGFLPITLSGLGVREGTFAFLLTTLGVSLNRGISASLIAFVWGQIPPAFLGLIIYLFYKKRTANPVRQQ